MNLEQILAIIDRIGTDDAPSSSELTTARTELSRLLHAEARSDAPDLAVMTSIRESYSIAGEALAAAEIAEQEARDQVEGLLDGVDDPDGEGEGDEPPAEGADGGEGNEGNEPPAEGEGDELPPPAGDPAGQPAPEGERQSEPVAAGGNAPRTMPLREAAARVTLRPPPERGLQDENPVEGAEIFMLGRQLDHVPDIWEAAGAFTSAFRSPNTGKQTLVQFNTVFDPDTPMLGTNKAENTRVLDEHVGPEAVAAAGGCCSLPTVIRTQNVLSSTATPLIDSLPTIGVFESGAVMYYPAICLPDTGAWEWTCADDEAVDPEDPETWKNCAVIDCPTEDRTNVEAIYRCLTIGEFQRRFATEQWAGVLRATMSLQARTAELQAWTMMLAGVTDTCTQADTGSTFSNFVQAMQREADFIRQDQRYVDVQLRLWVSENIVGAIASDFATRRLEFADPTIVRTMIANAATNANVNITYLPDTDPMTDNDCAVYPATFTAILAPEGYYSYLNGGQFDLGSEIRDIDLARQNAVAAFAESFGAVLARGCRAKRLNIPNSICVDAAGCLVS